MVYVAAHGNLIGVAFFNWYSNSKPVSQIELALYQNKYKIDRELARWGYTAPAFIDIEKMEMVYVGEGTYMWVAEC